MVYLESYFEQFHCYWPIIHRPSHEEEANETDLCELSMRMVGAWFLGTNEAVRFAVDTHVILLNHVMSQLCQFTSQDKFQQSLPISVCNAALLNIIFALYHGHERETSRAVVLWNILMAVLRETGFFKLETAWSDEKTGYFPPMRSTKLGERQRLAYNLYKLDAYMSVIGKKPMTIFPEELHFPLPCTLSFWNSNGLHLWEERQIDEPLYRDSVSMHSLIVENALNSSSAQEQPMLIEDIHLCLCAMQSDIWNLSQSTAFQTDCDTNNVLRKDILRRRLDGLKSRLDQITVQPVSNLNFGQEELLPLRYYYGYEDHNSSNWYDAVTTRVNNMLFDATMLYFLLSLNLSVDVRKITQLARDQQLSTVEDCSEAHRLAREQRQTSMKGWTSTPAVRFALCQAIDVLVAHQTFENGFGTSANARSVGPICHVALCVSALIVWTFCKYCDHGCEICVPRAIPVAELTRWSASGNQFAKEKEDWIEMRGQNQTARPQLQGIQFCDCNKAFLKTPFQACLPNGFALAEIIAPGIFKNSTGRSS
ncbi:hypothetical protein BKA61DRAFT_53613 [Leptodontidium sp. MPI-SDFR-AT-0119]|nr:hypothetical protein BKA61DRAFT_53613 [Leptodontidium sp. MPI-SDFR-AT-0119]